MRFLLLIVCLVNASCQERKRTNPPPQPTPSFDLVVMIVIDQWPSWTFTRDKDYLRGGLGRLIKHGRVTPRLRIPYAWPLTAPGHASLGTGVAPKESGIVANGWYENGNIVRAVGSSHPGDRLLVSGLADRWRQANPGSKVVSISGKKRAAVLMTGRNPDLALWYDDDNGTFATNQHYALASREWVKALAEKTIDANFLWRAEDESVLAKMSGIADDNPGEGGYLGIAPAFPHKVGTSPKPYKMVRATPRLDQFTLELAKQTIEKEQLYKNSSLLAISLSACDVAGHVWGQESWERREVLLQADKSLAEFLSFLDTRVGANHYAVVVTSDHGATPLVEHSVAAGHKATRIQTKAIQAVAEAAAVSVLGKSEQPLVATVVSSMIYLSDAAKQDERFAAAERAIAAAVAGLPHVARTITSAELATLNDCVTKDAMLRAVCLSYHAKRSGQIAVIPAERSLVSDGYVTGTHHNAPYDFERDVPLLLFAPGRSLPSVKYNTEVADLVLSLSRRSRN